MIIWEEVEKLDVDLIHESNENNSSIEKEEEKSLKTPKSNYDESSWFVF